MRHRWTRLATSIEIVGLFALVIGGFLYVQYNNVSSLCAPASVHDPCHKWQVRSDAGIGLMVLGTAGVVGGFLLAWLKSRPLEKVEPS